MLVRGILVPQLLTTLEFSRPTEESCAFLTQGNDIAQDVDRRAEDVLWLGIGGDVMLSAMVSNSRQWMTTSPSMPALAAFFYSFLADVDKEGPPPALAPSAVVGDILSAVCFSPSRELGLAQLVAVPRTAAPQPTF